MSERGWSQHQLADILDYSQSWVSNVMRSTQSLTLDQARTIVLRFGAPLHKLTIASGHEAGEGQHRAGALTLAGKGFSGLGVDAQDISEREDDDPVRRRSFVGLAGAGLFGAAVGGLGRASDDPADPLDTLTAALTGYRPPGGVPADGAPVSIPGLTAAVAAAKGHYQACRYQELAAGLPDLLARVEVACDALDGDDRLRACALSADAHHAAASLLLKLGDDGLAWLAADRSVKAAARSEDPLVVGSSARILTHVLMNGRHFQHATLVASTEAQHLDAALGTPTPESLSVYGSLLLRGTIAAAQSNNRGAAADLLGEADEAARRLGSDLNLRWTAFGPTNVLQHRVNIAVTLGDAGQAIDYARQVDLSRIPITERKAALLIDTARALVQWQKYERAFHVLRAADQLAHQEIIARPAVRKLVSDLMAQARPSLRSQPHEFARQIGLPE